MIEAFRQYIHQNQLCFAGEKILIAVSGGIDSVVLLDLFSKTDFNFSIAHCNFSLRGEESDQDEQFVSDLAKKYTFTFYVKNFDTKKISNDTGLSIQETARNLRYNWFNELAGKNNFDHIAVAHHFDDQVETFFINLFRGSGVSGLKGMPVKREKLIRPLLFARRSEIEQYATENNLAFREDSSNFSDKYLRNRIRHKILPEIEKLATNFPVTLSKSLQNLADDELLLKQFIFEKKQSIFLTKNNQIRISQSDLLNLESPAIWIFYLLKDFGFSRAVTDEILIALADKKVGKVFYSHSHQLLVDREQLIVRELQQVKNENGPEKNNNFSFPMKLVPSVIENKPGLKFSKKPAIAYFDFEKLQFPLLIRRWKKGDQFIPFGMKGNKLVSDYLIDCKVDKFEKDHTYVLLSGNEIIWVIGKRVSEVNKVTTETNKIYQVQVV